MFKYFRLFFEPLRVPMMYGRRLGSGRTISVFVSDNGIELNNLKLKFERKIVPTDVKEGKLVPITIEELRRRGGKRSTTITLTYEAAEALQLALKSALRDARKRRFWHYFSNRMMFSFFELTKQ